ncbi:LacI family DNA-binding transcriptional regulator [Novosphingobium flavum]|uniref:LacI family DNA-binding transcriptional regulator n=1 Tax=Novosphingobium aerophilum TaxID=2839843 RepID=A0A7X1KC03_9SPHN|nr:LacI family DNA-binding transcriptional regulator [Novosphingobium aerophilum]MBC2651607.1 LacI family DNA-binding transcriptional regulator [Novosphingobium aerophilum]MBC2661480.1 LacI family DNA-binding transcriptional regulator [Novosphingobium aerophilum]
MTTIRDIARHAGVSVTTVSRTLREPEAVRRDKRDRVHAAIAELSYVPNAIAQQLRRPRAEAIIVIVPAIDNPFFSGIIQSIENVAHELGYRVLIGETQGRQERLDHYADMVTARLADGLILLGSLLPTPVRSAFEAGRPVPIPLVLACERYDGLDCPSVTIDNAAAAEAAADHLIRTGRQRIATITGPLANPLAMDRLAGFRAALQRAGMTADEEAVVEGNFSVESGHEGMQRLLSGPRRPDAVFCANDEMAIGAIRAAVTAGLSVPGELAVVGFDDLRFGAFATPPLTTIRQPTAGIGETAMRMMDAELHQRGLSERQVVLPHELVVRGSSVVAA